MLAQIIKNDIPDDVWVAFFIVCAAIIIFVVAYYWR
jgi:hypothetical protein